MASAATVYRGVVRRGGDVTLLPGDCARRYVSPLTSLYIFHENERLTEPIHKSLHRQFCIALTVDIHAWSVEEVYAALGREPVKAFEFMDGPRSPTESMNVPRPPTNSDSPRQPQYLVCPLSVSRLEASALSICLINFTEFFRAPLATKFCCAGAPPRTAIGGYHGDRRVGARLHHLPLLGERGHFVRYAKRLQTT